jgi:hypothetical protein
MPTWMNTSDWDDHRYAIPSNQPSRRVRFFFLLVDGVCSLLRRVRR